MPILTWLVLFPFRSIKWLTFSCWSSPVIFPITTETLSTQNNSWKIIGLTNDEEVLLLFRGIAGLVVLVLAILSGAEGDSFSAIANALMVLILGLPWLVSLGLVYVVQPIWRLTTKTVSTEATKIRREWAEADPIKPTLPDAESLGRASQDTADLPRLPVGGLPDTSTLPRAYSPNENGDDLHCGVTHG